MSVKKYLIGLAATFAVGMGAGTYLGCKYSKDIQYGLAKAERFMAAGSEALRESSPGPAEYGMGIMDQIKTGKTKDEAADMRKERLDRLDKVIEEHESKE